MSDDFSTASEKTSYCIGLDVGASFQRFPIDVHLDAFIHGVTDAANGKTPRLTQPEFTALMRTFHEQLERQSQELRRAEAERNREAGREFMGNNANNPAVEVTDSGLQVEMVSEGTGPKPNADTTVRVHYRGSLIDGTEFDSSLRRGQPAEFTLGQVIPGWTEGLQHLGVGGKAKLVIPPELAYGEQGAGQLIGPNATLIFEVELLEIMA